MIIWIFLLSDIPKGNQRYHFLHFKEPRCWWLIETRNCSHEKKITFDEQIQRQWAHCVKISIFVTQTFPLDSPNTPFQWFNGVQLFMADKRHPKEDVCMKQNKITEQILRYYGKRCKNCHYLAYRDPNRGSGDPLRVIQWGPTFHGW